MLNRSRLLFTETVILTEQVFPDEYQLCNKFLRVSSRNEARALAEKLQHILQHFGHLQDSSSSILLLERMASRTTNTFKSTLKKTDEKPKKEFCTIPSTSNRKVTRDVFKDMRPKQGIYADYDISQTDIKMDAGSTKIHLERTTAEYVSPPPGVKLSQPQTPKKMKIKYSHGGPPVWEFLDEKRKKETEKMQEFYKERLEKLISESKKVTGRKRRSKNN